MGFAPIQKSVDDWIRNYTPGYFQPLQMIARLDEVGDELCDLIFVAVCLANSMKIDLDTEWKTLLSKLHERDAERWKSESTDLG